MTIEKLPIDQKLVENLRQAKSALALAQQIVQDAESAIYVAVKSSLPEKGTTHFQGVKIVTGFYAKWNSELLNDIETTWARKSNLAWPFKKEWKPDTKALSYLQEHAKDNYAALEPALTLSDKKPSFELTEA